MPLKPTTKLSKIAQPPDPRGPRAWLSNRQGSDSRPIRSAERDPEPVPCPSVEFSPLLCRRNVQYSCRQRSCQTPIGARGCLAIGAPRPTLHRSADSPPHRKLIISVLPPPTSQPEQFLLPIGHRVPLLAATQAVDGSYGRNGSWRSSGRQSPAHGSGAAP